MASAQFREKLGPYLINLPIMSVVTFFAGAATIYSAIVPEKPPWQIAGLFWIVPIACIVYVIRRFNDLHKYSDLKAPGEIFFPVMPIGAKARAPWERTETVSKLVMTLQQLREMHLLLIGSSGTGKTTLVSQLLKKHPIFADYEFTYLNEYVAPLEHILFQLAKSSSSPRAAAAYNEFVIAFPSHIETGQIDAATTRIDEIFDLVPSDKQMVFVLDQAERFISRVESEIGKASIGSPAYLSCLRHALRRIRKNQMFRSIFCVRNEFLFRSLVSLFDMDKTGGDEDGIVRLFFVWGINSMDDPADAGLARQSIAILTQLAITKNKIHEVVNLDNRQGANTFLLHVVGYLIEKYNERKEVLELIDSSNIAPQSQIENYLDLFLKIVFEGWVKRGGRLTDKVCFDTMLHAIAIDTKTSGEAITLARIGGLSHFPVSDVEPILAYLASVGIVTEHKDSNATCYRMVHDILGDHIVQSNSVNTLPQARDAIGFLSENNARLPHLTCPAYFPRAIDYVTRIGSLFTRPEIDPASLAIATFVLFGIARISAPDAIRDIIQPVAAVFFAPFSPTSFEFYAPGYMYFPHFIAHVLWLTYIDRLMRGYVQYLLPKPLRNVSAIFVILGVILGVLVSFSPQLFVLPICVVGIMFALTLLLVSRQKTAFGASRQLLMLWGLRTLSNLAFALMLIPVLNLMLGSQLTEIFAAQGVPETAYRFGAMYVTGILFVWFWMHIRLDQNTPGAWSAKLAIHDRSRLGHHWPSV